MANFMSRQLSSCPKRSIPIVAIDNNSEYSCITYCEESVGLFSVGSGGSSSRVHGSGEVMVEIGNLHIMAAVNMFFDSGATWFVRHSESIIDCVLLPLSFIAFV